MKNLKKINFAEISDKQALSIDQLSKIIGGGVDDACKSNICAQNVDANTKYCEGSAVCTHAVTTCVKNSETDNNEQGGDSGNENDKPTCALAVCIINA
ncbi:hypothetical protein [Bacteroides acidifaciens]|uniref:hypothetical protein n=1 Tax=Bacteroides acidifaciens TaxID=85831 RepID=UPI00242F2843|nr:hypothetical protein [Bacteroides acidifaciens]